MSLIKIFYMRLKRSLRKISKLHQKKTLLHELPTNKLMALARHDAHRIEKSIYNNILEKNLEIYQRKRRDILIIIDTLVKRGISPDEPTLARAKQICDNFYDLQAGFIGPNSSNAPTLNNLILPNFIDFLKTRRSVRVWSKDQPSNAAYQKLAHHLIDSARWAPTSGNRQPWRFKILLSDDDKKLLTGIKEHHCISAPLLIFIGMDTQVYGAFGNNERGLYIDAGAAIMSMILTAHKAGFGTCWNHFADDLISTRNNAEIYKKFCEHLSIPSWISPIAILAVGRSAFTPPNSSTNGHRNTPASGIKHEKL